MKKNLLFGFAAALTLASCTTNDDVLEVSSQRDLSFSTFVDKTTKAPVTTLETDNSTFKVWGFYIPSANPWSTSATSLWSDGETVSRVNGIWGYTNLRKWIPNSKYRFYAVSPASITHSVTQGNDNETGTVTFENFQIAGTEAEKINDFSSQVDLMVATRYDRSTDEFNNAPINFIFKHVLTKVNVVFKTTSAYDVILKSVELGNVNTKGNAIIKPSPTTETSPNLTATGSITAAWDNQTLPKTFIGKNNTVTLESVTPFISIADLLMIPQEFSENKGKLKLKVTYTVGGNGDTSNDPNASVFTKELDIVDTWNHGHNVTYTITINTGNNNGNGTDITFGKTDVAGWETNDSNTPDID